MQIRLPESERQLLRQAQRTYRGKAGYMPVTALLMLDRGRSVTAVAEDPGLDEATVYHYAQTYHLLGLTGYLKAEQPGYWGLLTSAQLAGLCQELAATLYTDCRALVAWLHTNYGITYSVSGPAAGPGRGRASHGLFRRCGPPHPQHPRHARLDRKGQRAPAADR